MKRNDTLYIGTNAMPALLAATVLLCASAARAGVGYDLANAASYNMAFDGDQAEGRLSPCASGDLNGDGIPDLEMSSMRADHKGRADAGSIFVVYGPVISTTTGNTKAIASNYNVRVDGWAISSYLNACWSADLNNDGQDDLLIEDYYATRLYVLYGPLPAGTGNLLDLTNSAQYNIRIDVPAGYSGGGYGTEVFPQFEDLNNDGITDLLVEMPYADTNGADSGALYAFYGPLPAGTGINKVLLTDAASYNLRISGGGASWHMTHSGGQKAQTSTSGRVTKGFALGDLNGDGVPDLVIGAAGTAYNGARTGSVFVSTGPFPAGTGNNWIISDSGRFLVRYDGIANYNSYNGLSAPLIADFSGDGSNDLCMGESNATLGATQSGGVYCVLGPLDYTLATYKDLNSAGNWNLRLYVTDDYSTLGYSLANADLNNDGVQDLIVSAPSTDIAGQFNGAFYVIYGGAAWPAGTGNDKNLTTASSYNLRLTYSANTYARLGAIPPVLRDIDRDGVMDIVMTRIGYDGGTWSPADIDNCSNGQGLMAVFNGPLPAGTGNNLDFTTNQNMYFLPGGGCQAFNAGEQMQMASYPLPMADFNGDGQLDFVMYRIFSDVGFSNSGRVWVVSGALTAAKVTAPFLFTNNTAPTIAWTAVSGAANYQMQLGTDPFFLSTVSDQTVGTNSASVSGLSSGSSYYVRVRATNGNYPNRWGPTANFTVDTTAPTAPTLLTPGDASDTHPPVGTQTPSFDWTDASNE